MRVFPRRNDIEVFLSAVARGVEMIGVMKMAERDGVHALPPEAFGVFLTGGGGKRRFMARVRHAKATLDSIREASGGKSRQRAEQREEKAIARKTAPAPILPIMRIDKIAVREMPASAADVGLRSFRHHLMKRRVQVEVAQKIIAVAFGVNQEDALLAQAGKRVQNGEMVRELHFLRPDPKRENVPQQDETMKRRGLKRGQHGEKCCCFGLCAL